MSLLQHLRCRPVRFREETVFDDDLAKLSDDGLVGVRNEDSAAGGGWGVDGSDGWVGAARWVEQSRKYAQKLRVKF